MAQEGPDSDALKGMMRDSGGKGVHFSGPGLREHAARWVEKVGVWLERELEVMPGGLVLDLDARRGVTAVAKIWQILFSRVTVADDDNR